MSAVMKEEFDWTGVIQRLEAHMIDCAIASMCSVPSEVPLLDEDNGSDTSDYDPTLIGDVFTTDEWIAACDVTMFVDYDGHGYPIVMNAERRGYKLRPSDFGILRGPPPRSTPPMWRRMRNRERLRANCKYVVWFNR